MSGDSNDSRDFEIRFLSPDSKRKIKNERCVYMVSDCGLRALSQESMSSNLQTWKD